MLRATAVFTLLIAVMAAGVVLAQSVTPTRVIRSQSVIGADDVAVSDEAAPGAVADPGAVIGREARVTLYPGRPILGGQTGAPALIERNQIVRMNFANGPLSITTEGRALDRAGVGELVRVMNLASRQVVTGAVAADGSIEVRR